MFILNFVKINMETIKNIFDIAQSIVIIAATIFTARWTYKTFAHSEKIKELKELKALIINYFHKVQIFCAQVRDNKTPDDREISEKIALAEIRNKLAQLKEINLYTKSEVREKIQMIVGTWITNSDRLKAMQSRKTEEERTKAWQDFENEYNEVKKLIDKEADKLI